MGSLGALFLGKIAMFISGAGLSIKKQLKKLKKAKETVKQHLSLPEKNLVSQRINCFDHTPYFNVLYVYVYLYYPGMYYVKKG